MIPKRRWTEFYTFVWVSTSDEVKIVPTNFRTGGGGEEEDHFLSYLPGSGFKEGVKVFIPHVNYLILPGNKG